MDNKKFEQLIDLIINENEEQARALFHDIVVEKSREIYESLMDDDSMEGTQVGSLLDEISADEEGMTEEEDLEFDDEEEMDVDMEMGDEDEEGHEEDLEDRVVDLEDKLDQLMAEFEEIMAGEEGGEEGEEMEFDAEEEGEEEGSEEMMEAIQLQKVAVTHGDNGVQTKSPVAANSGKAGMASHPVKMETGEEKGRTAPSVKDVKDASSWGNVPAKKKADLESAPKAHTAQAAGVNTKSPLGESRTTPKKRV